MMDMDNFKQVNDILGHSYGDQVIIRFGQLLKSLYGKEVVIGRLGGDEFALYYQAGSDAAESKEEFFARIPGELDRVQESFAKEFEQESETCNLSVSAGVYAGYQRVLPFAEMYEKADSALYASKKKGKKRYTIYKEEQT
jgi:diguanylate cyclase (GGDEF)-like protein